MKEKYIFECRRRHSPLIIQPKTETSRNRGVGVPEPPVRGDSDLIGVVILPSMTLFYDREQCLVGCDIGRLPVKKQYPATASRSHYNSANNKPAINISSQQVDDQLSNRVSQTQSAAEPCLALGGVHALDGITQGGARHSAVTVV